MASSNSTAKTCTAAFVCGFESHGTGKAKLPGRYPRTKRDEGGPLLDMNPKSRSDGPAFSREEYLGRLEKVLVHRH